MAPTRPVLLLAVALGAGCASHPTVRPDEIGPEEPTLSAPPAAHALPAPSPSRRARVSTGVLARRDLLEVLDASPGLFFQKVQPEPMLNGRQFHGWRLATFFPGDPRLSSVDLQAGDVVVAVNGQPVGKIDDFMRVWEGLRTSSELVVSYERDGQARELRFEIR